MAKKPPGKYKKRHIAFAIWIIIFKILVIASLIYIATILIEIKTDLDLTRETQLQIEEQISTNQQSMQSQINEISDSLFIFKEDLDDEIAKVKAEAGSDFSGIIEQVIPGVVSIGTDISQGSGFIISEDGYTITNYHVLEGASYARILQYETDEWILVEPIGFDAALDIAIVKIPGSGHEYIDFGNSDETKVGEKAIAIGNPLGLSFSVTEGIISALKRNGPNEIPAYTQIDTPLNPGNSGGPLVNKQGKVIGINNFKLQDSENLGFALESNYAVDVINNIFIQTNQTIRI
jgi:S1-C subfamily serine protease